LQLALAAHWNILHEAEKEAHGNEEQDVWMGVGGYVNRDRDYIRERLLE